MPTTHHPGPHSLQDLETEIVENAVCGAESNIEKL